MENLKNIVEALIFASDVPLSAGRIKDILGECEKSEITETIRGLVHEYEERQGGLYLQEVAGGFQFRTKPDLGAWIKKLKGTKPTALSQPAMETLAIIAYRQPVVKADIERMRGVDVSGPLRGLLDKKLVRMVGRKDVPGKPILYGTTKRFLEIFNLNDLSDLPTLRELKELQENKEEKQTQDDAQEFLPLEAQWQDQEESASEGAPEADEPGDVEKDEIQDTAAAVEENDQPAASESETHDPEPSNEASPEKEPNA